MTKCALVTGGSSGIGKETAVRLKKSGFNVFAAARRVDQMRDLEEAGVQILPLDVTDEASMQACIDEINTRAGGVDILVNNAGYGSYGAVEDVPIEEAKRQFEVNIFGLARLTQLVLPHMREKGWGRIINISSMGGKIHTPFGAWYHATKFALEGFSDCLRYETEEFGIDVVVVEPGGIKTEWGTIAADKLLETSGSGAYGEAATKAAESMRANYEGDKLSPPSLIADTIVTASTAKKPKTRYLTGYMAKPAVFMRGLMSDRGFDKFIRSAT